MAYKRLEFTEHVDKWDGVKIRHLEDGIVVNESGIAAIRGEVNRTVLTPISTINGYYINNSGTLVTSNTHVIEVYDVSGLDMVTMSGSNSQSATIPLCAFGNDVSGANLAQVIKNTDHPVFSYPVSNENGCAYLFISIGANHCLQVFAGNINDRADARISAIEAIVGTRDNAVQLTPDGTIGSYYINRSGGWKLESPGFKTDYYKVRVGERLRVYCEATATAYAAWAFFRDEPTLDKAPNEYYRGKSSSDGVWIEDAVAPYDGYFAVSHTDGEKAFVYSLGLHPRGMTGLYIGDSISTANAYKWKAWLEDYYGIKYARDISGKLPPANASMCVIPPETEEESLSKKSIWYRCGGRHLDAYQFDFINLFGGVNDLVLDYFELGTIDDTPYLDTTETRPETVTFAAALMGCVEMLYRDFPDKPIILCTITPTTRGATTDSSGVTLAERMARLQCQIANKYAGLGYTIACVPWYWDMQSAGSAYRSDGVHPNNVGSLYMVGVWYNTVGKYLESVLR